MPPTSAPFSRIDRVAAAPESGRDFRLLRFLLKHRWRIPLAAMLLTATGAAGAMFLAGSEIASPTRRPVMDYHREYLDHPAAHGLVIDRFIAKDGTPCLVCTPDPAGRLGERGERVRKQLAERRHVLAPAGRTVGTLVLVHGRKGRKEDYLPIAERLCAAGFRCVIPDMPAHGDHPVKTVTYGVREAGIPARVLLEASRRLSFDPQPAGLLGMSMGGSVSMHAAALPNAPWKALAVISSFDSFPKVIEGQAARYIGSTLGPLWAKGTDLVYRSKTGIPLTDIQPHRQAACVIVPTLIAHGTADPVSSMGRGKSLYDSLPASTTKKWIEVPGATHDNVLITPYPIYADLAEWMLRHVAGK